MVTGSDNSEAPDFDSHEARAAMRRRHVELGLRLQAVANYALAELERKVAAGQPLNMNREQAETLRDAGEKIEREALGDGPGDLKKPN